MRTRSRTPGGGARSASAGSTRGSGGQLIVEGFAELSSWLAVRDRLGDEALLRLLSERQYDPRRGGTLENLSALDNLRDPSSRETIYDKGGYVALMLRQRLGADVFESAARQFIDRFRYKSATDRDLQSVFGEVAKADLDDFFGAWVRSDRELDLSLDAQDGGAAVRNYGKAPSPAQIDLWRFPPGGEPERQSIAVDGTTPVGNVERLVLDPSGSHRRHVPRQQRDAAATTTRAPWRARRAAI